MPIDSRPLIEQQGGNRFIDQKARNEEMQAERERKDQLAALGMGAAAAFGAGVAFAASPAGQALLSRLAGLMGRGEATDAMLTDNSPSSVIAFAEYDPETFSLTVHTKHGKSYSYTATPDVWVAYVGAPSKGGFMNDTWWR